FTGFSSKHERVRRRPVWIILRHRVSRIHFVLSARGSTCNKFKCVPESRSAVAGQDGDVAAFRYFVSVKRFKRRFHHAECYADCHIGSCSMEFPDILKFNFQYIFTVVYLYALHLNTSSRITSFSLEKAAAM